MTARILVVDEAPSTARALETGLLADHFSVMTAGDAGEAVGLCEAGAVDVVLLDARSDPDGVELCRQLKTGAATMHIPVVLMTAAGETADRVHGLAAGADDFLTKPADVLQLVTRVRSLARLKALTDTLRLRAPIGRPAGAWLSAAIRHRPGSALPKILLIGEDAAASARIAAMLENRFAVDLEDDPQRGFFRAAEGEHDCVLVATAMASYDPLRLCGQLRALDRTRALPVLVIVGEGEEALVKQALNLAVSDYVEEPVEENELIARLNTQLRRRRYNDLLRASAGDVAQTAVTDPLTGLFNRRHLDNQLQALIDRAVNRKRPLSLMMADIDGLRQINERWGREGGDQVLRAFADRLRKNIRGIDLLCRFGGEEFVIVMPETEPATARLVAERVRTMVADEPFAVGGGIDAVPVTISLGVAALQGEEDTEANLLKRADLALCEAKSGGRNRVAASAA